MATKKCEKINDYVVAKIYYIERLNSYFGFIMNVFSPTCHTLGSVEIYEEKKP